VTLTDLFTLFHSPPVTLPLWFCICLLDSILHLSLCLSGFVFVCLIPLSICPSAFLVCNCSHCFILCLSVCLSVCLSDFVLPIIKLLYRDNAQQMFQTFRIFAFSKFL
jgi:hypothetical protein